MTPALVITFHYGLGAIQQLSIRGIGTVPVKLAVGRGFDAAGDGTGFEIDFAGAFAAFLEYGDELRIGRVRHNTVSKKIHGYQRQREIPVIQINYAEVESAGIIRRPDVLAGAALALAIYSAVLRPYRAVGDAPTAYAWRGPLGFLALQVAVFLAAFVAFRSGFAPWSG